MGKSPGKWMKTVLFGKKSSKSNLSKDATLDKKASITINSHSKDLGADSTVISSPVCHDVSREHTQLEKSSSANLLHNTSENVIHAMGLNPASDDELIKLQQAATKAQAAFRGYLARRAFWALKGIIRLQALVRGHLVRRQAVVTLSCMRGIVEFQALVRGQRVRLSGNGLQMLQKRTPRAPVQKKRGNLLQTSLKSEKLSTNAFGSKLVTSSNTIKPLNIQYDPTEPNSVNNWLERWSSSHFWEPLSRPRKIVDVKPKRKQTKLQSEETETTRPKRSTRRVPAPNLNINSPLNSSENVKTKRTARKVSTLQPESVQEQSHCELEKVKHNLRKLSVSAVGDSKKLEVESNNVNVIVVKHPEPETLGASPLEDKQLDVDPNVDPSLVDSNEKVENVESNGKENQKTRRRKSFPTKQEYPASNSPNTPTVPSYMAATESAKAKLRAQAAAKAAEDGGENGFIRRHSLSSSTGKLGLQSPRVQKSLQANDKGGSKTNKPQISPRDGQPDLTRPPLVSEKVVSAGWRR